jgi:hypothetical protein
MRQSKTILAIGGLLVLLAGGWFVFSPEAMPVKAENVDTADVGGSGMLDGMTFSAELGPLGKPADVNDRLVFANGTFVSTECERRCGYPARPYFIRQVGDRIEFISETRCPDKDAKIVWRGTVDDGTIKGVFTWTTVRWYWTIEKEFSFEGTLVEGATPIVSSR